MTTQSNIALADLLKPATFSDYKTGLPYTNLSQEVHLISRFIRNALPQHSLFLLAGQLVALTRNPFSQLAAQSPLKVNPITPACFVTFVAKYCKFVAREPDLDSLDKQKHISLPLPTANLVLSDLDFLGSTPLINDTCPLLLPIWPRDAKGVALPKLAYQLAPEGYEPHTGLYSCNSLPFNRNSPKLSLDEIKANFVNIFGEFPFDGAETPTLSSRSFAAAVASTIGQYLRHLIKLPPIIAANANQAGSGKTFLLKTILSGVHAPVAVTNLPNSDDELSKKINACILGGSNVLFLDNIRYLTSPAIEALVTNDTIVDRFLNTNTSFLVKNRLQVAITGNNIKTNPDTERRCSWIDLELNTKPNSRKFSGKLTGACHSNPRWRTSLNYLCDQAYQRWLEDGAPKHCDGSILTSFEDYAELTGSIVMHMGLVNPFTERAAWAQGGDVQGRAFTVLLRWIAGCITPASTELAHTGLKFAMTRDAILAIATRKDLLADIAGNDKHKQANSFGHKVADYNGRKFIDEHGREFQYIKGRNSAQTLYYINILSEPTDSSLLPIRAQNDIPCSNPHAKADRRPEEVIYLDKNNDVVTLNDIPTYRP